MSEFWAITWLIIKYGLILGLSLGLIALLIVVFHPICITLKGRGSLKGQRGEANLSYLFGLVHLRYIASPHTQDVWLEIWRFRKLLQRESVIENKVNRLPDEKSAESEASLPQSSDEKDISDFRETKEEKSENITQESIIEELQKEEQKEKAPETAPLESSTKEESISEKAETPKETTSETSSEQEKESIEESFDKSTEQPEEPAIEEKVEEENKQDEAEPKIEVTPEQLAQLQSILEEEEKKEATSKAKKVDFNAKLRKFKQDFNRRYEKLRSTIILIKQKWNSLWPVAQRFWNRGKKGFRFHEAYLKVEYSLDEHYLTGMCFGYIAPTVGFAKRYGLNFEPVPVFPNTPEVSIYSKALWQIDIKPYRLIWAVTALLFEKNLYKEIIWLYKKRKAQKNKK
ncbi:MAG: hypothetical protein J6Z11_14085 [Candidatus Riflebacteria bacterium]|nr:hypothetical protein [Candidatus Riflebacteria bacterium]